MKTNYKLIIAITFLFAANASHAQSFTSQNISLLLGDWKGSLTYLDYTTKKPYTMPADLKVSSIAGTHQLIFLNLYPNEPKANNADTITFTKKGRRINNERVTSKRTLGDGNTEVVTEYNGVDGNDNKSAIIRHTYLLGNSVYKNTKEVKFKGESAWIKRHEYNYTRK